MAKKPWVASSKGKTPDSVHALKNKGKSHKPRSGTGTKMGKTQRAGRAAAKMMGGLPVK